MTRLYAVAACGVSGAGESLKNSASIGLHQRASLSAGIVIGSGVALALSVSSVAAWSVPIPLSSGAPIAISAGDHHHCVTTDLPWISPVPLQSDAQINIHLASVSLAGSVSVEIHQAAAHATELQAPQLGTNIYSIRPSEYDLRQSELLTGVSGSIKLNDAPYIPSPVVRIASFNLTDLPAFPIRTSSALRAYQPPEKQSESELPWGAGESLHYSPDLPYLVEPPLLPGAPVYAPDDRETYITMHLVNVIALPGNEPLDATNLRLDLDRDSTAWRVQFDLHNDAAAALVEPDLSSEKEVAIEINGWRWECFISKVRESKTVDTDALNCRWSVTGFSRVQYLGSPYAPLRTSAIASTTAVQAATTELSGTGYTLDWDTAKITDWPMAGSSFSYQSKNPLQVIKRLASVAGGIVQADLTGSTVKVRPRYWPLPWNLATATPDHSISIHQVQARESWREHRDLVNAVFVSGEQSVSGAVALNVVRYGTAGDKPGDDVTDAWLTDYQANKSRGEQDIAASGIRMMYSLTVEVPESQQTEPGIPLPGETVAVVYDDSADSFRAYVDAISISAPGRGLASVTQTLTLDRPIEWEV